MLFDSLRDSPFSDRDLEEPDALMSAAPECGHGVSGALERGSDWVVGSGELDREIVAITACDR